MSTPPSIVRLSPWLQSQRGVVTARQAEEVDVPRRTLSRMVQRGELVRRYRGVYVSVAYPDSPEQRWWAAVLAPGGLTAVSHKAAAWLHGLEHTGTGRARPPLELTTPRRVDARIPDVTVHTATFLKSSDVVQVQGLPVTDVPWTLAANALRLGPERLLSAVDSAVARGLLAFEDFSRTSLRFRFCPGMVAIREVLERHLPEVAMTESEGERRFLRAVARAGLPMPVPNLRVTDARGRTRRLDLAWPEWGVAVEIDLHRGHLRALGRNADGRRQNALILDWTVLRFDEIDLRWGLELAIEDLRRVLAAAGAPV